MPDDLVKQITDGLSAIFRHMFPGLAIMGVAAISQGHWFPAWSTLSDGWHIAVLGAIALTVGNLWYAAHRYTLHQLIDYCYYVREPGHDARFLSYRNWLRKHIDDSFHVVGEDARLQRHVHFRSAQIILLFIIAEAVLVFSIKPDPHSIVFTYRWWFIGGAILMLFVWTFFQ